MREIKFRAWNKETGEMVDLEKITPLALSDSMNTQLVLQGIRGLFLPFNEKWPLMQFTGLHDKNGKDIYEGDIVKWPYYKHFKTGEIAWGGCGFWVKGYLDVLGEYRAKKDIEVIGNIYEAKKEEE